MHCRCVGDLTEYHAASELLNAREDIKQELEDEALAKTAGESAVLGSSDNETGDSPGKGAAVSANVRRSMRSKGSDAGQSELSPGMAVLGRSADRAIQFSGKDIGVWLGGHYGADFVGAGVEDAAAAAAAPATEGKDPASPAAASGKASKQWESWKTRTEEVMSSGSSPSLSVLASLCREATRLPPLRKYSGGSGKLFLEAEALYKELVERLSSGITWRAKVRPHLRCPPGTHHIRFPLCSCGTSFPQHAPWCRHYCCRASA